jgi:hypothetical protein
VVARVLKEGLLKYKEEILDENRHKVLKHLKCIYERKKRRLLQMGKRVSDWSLLPSFRRVE